MADRSFELEARIDALETRILALPRLRLEDAGNTNGCTNCNTNVCTNCIADELINVLLPGQEGALSGRDIVRLLQEAGERG